MREETIFLIKPDIRREEIVSTLLKECEKQNIEYSGMQQMILNEKQIIQLWEKSCCSDYVLRKILLKFYEQKPIQIIHVKGFDIYEKARQIKHYIRDRYAMDWYKNCIHSPDDHEEFLRDIAVLNSSNKEEITDEYLKAYDSMTRSYVDYLERNKSCLDVAIGLYLSIDKEWYFKRERQLKKKYSYLLEFADAPYDKTVTYVMARMHESMKDSTIDEELIIAEGLFMFGKIIAIGANDASALAETRQKASMYLKAILCNGSNI